MKSLHNNIFNISNKLFYTDNENRNLLKLINMLNLNQGHKILDIGCGYGNNIKLLRSKGLNVLGIDVNPDIVKKNVEAGLNCMTPEEYNMTTDIFDLLVMSHVIEHFNPPELLTFMDSHLDRLKKDGHLIISTPLLSKYFFADYDHVKPYYPTGINMVFGDESSQVQYYARNKLKLIDICFRKGSYRFTHYKGFYIDQCSKIPIILNIILSLLFRASFGIIGITDGWMGLYQKI
jgi:SAM-dependent methyltransferase